MDGTIYNQEHLFSTKYLVYPRLEKVKEIEKSIKKCPDENIQLIRARAIVAHTALPAVNLSNDHMIRHYPVPDR